MQKSQGIESRYQKELPSIGKEIPIKRFGETLGQLRFSLAQRQENGCGELLKHLLRSGRVSRWSTPFTRSHLGPPSYLRVSVVWMVPREILVLLVPR